MFFNSPLWFERLAPEKCELLAEQLGVEWHQDLSTGKAKRLLKNLVDRPTP